jgi:hypothetical protein
MKKAFFIVFPLLLASIYMGCSGVQTLGTGEFIAIAQGPPPEGQTLTHEMLKEKAHALAREKCPDYQVVDEGMYIYFGLGYEIIFVCGN